MSSKDNLPAVSKEDKQIALHDNGLRAGSIIDQSVRNLSAEEMSTLRMKAAEKAIDIEAKARMQAIDQHEGERATRDHIEAFDRLDKRGHLTSHKISSEIKTGAGKMNLESKSGATCFVATATYQNPEHPDVIFLRHFRDSFLSKHHLGQQFVGWYWKTGPKLAVIVRKSSVLRLVSLLSLRVLVRLLRVVVT